MAACDPMKIRVAAPMIWLSENPRRSSTSLTTPQATKPTVMVAFSRNRCSAIATRE